MPRSFSNRRPSRRSIFSAPAPVRKSPPPATIQGPSMKDSMKQGFGLGLGLEGARAAIGAVGGIFSGNQQSPQHAHQQSTHVHTQSQNENIEGCSLEKKLFERCLDETGNVDNECADFLKLYEKCTNKI